MKNKITIEKINIFLIGIIVFVFVIVSASMAISVVSKINAKRLEVKINNIKQNENEEKEYYVSKLKYLEISKNNINISNSNSNSIDDLFTKEMAFMYLEEEFKDNPDVVYSNIIDEIYIDNVKYYVAKLYNKELYEAYGGGIGNTLLIAKDKNIYDYMQIMDEE